MIWTILWIVLIIWLLGFIFNIVGGIIHILLVVAAAILIYKFLVKRS
ncbi:lmo0937 family membrane protein [Pseudalkalibacillus salsuginis]|nr:lmo0937 family membrane protein [Pseudalkalibacillus salsuginis]MCF6409469.1 lmo0937 family membrane protein [Pseudalkalibacillus salsuginis]